MTDSMIKNVRNISILLMIVFGIIIGTSPPSIGGLLTYLIFSFVTAFVYYSKDLQSYLVGIGKKNLGRVIIFGVIGGFAFIFLTKLIPGLSIGVPLLPESIGDQLRFVIIVGFAPIVEEFLFRGAILGFFKQWFHKEQLAIILQAVLFAFAHLGAYISGFYDYSSLTVGLTSVSANASVFISAGLFAYLMGYFISKKGIQNLWFSIIVHTIINFMAFGTVYSIFG